MQRVHLQLKKDLARRLVTTLHSSYNATRWLKTTKIDLASSNPLTKAAENDKPPLRSLHSPSVPPPLKCSGAPVGLKEKPH
ncbi:hypothetical protein BRADI_4g05655v3 [Brachypodium distachyon]|uniref:Uncharacterized protein n=1 Tax=Brachypodium distachyon TaxID=15368 RepID=A0A2K2CKP2_BRADI|nr:hypothetical protein BRADI_4g05655v3 [Brachypodium distachyon]